MTVIKEIVTVLCVVAVGFGCIQMFIPKGGAEKSAHGLLCLVLILFVTMVANKGLNFDISFPQLDTQTIPASIDVNGSIVSLSQGEIEKQIKNILQEDGVSLQEIKVYMDISDNNSISINKIIITLNQEKEANKDIVQNKVYTLTGVYPQLIFKG